MSEENEESKSSQSSSDSSSASGPSSPDALDLASVRDLSAALHGLRQGLDDEREHRRAEARKGDFRQQMTLNVIEKNTAVTRALVSEVRNALRLNREVVASGRGDVEVATKRLEDASRKIKTYQPEDGIEITKERVRVSASWSALMTMAARIPIAVKVLGALAAAAAGAWAVVRSYLPHR